MRKGPTVALSGSLHSQLARHLLNGDGREAAAIVLCARVEHPRLKLLAQRVILVPHEACERHADHLVWPGSFLEEALDQAEEQDLSLLLVHSHPGGYFQFSELDDASDQEVFPALFLARASGCAGPLVHGSAIIVPGGAMRARVYDPHMRRTDVELTAVYGDDLKFYWGRDEHVVERRPMAFTSDMGDELKRLSACVVGASGIGSLVFEQVARMGFGEIILIDFDHVEDKNLNRIVNATAEDASQQRLKVDVLAEAAGRHHPATKVHAVPLSISRRAAVEAAASADVLFCCVDSEEGRNICDRLASAFVMPLFDAGVVIPVRETADTTKVIMDLLGRVDYVQPGGSSLADRGVFTPQSLAAEDLAQRDPAAHEAQVKAGYMPGAQEEAPSVITVNMRAASASVGEFLARAYPFRLDPNRRRARTIFSMAACDEDAFSEGDLPHSPAELLGVGFAAPLLGLTHWST